MRSVGFIKYFIDHHGWEISYGNINGTKENSLLPNNLYCCKPTTGQLDFAGCGTKTNINSTFLGCATSCYCFKPESQDVKIAQYNLNILGKFGKVYSMCLIHF